NQILIPLGLDTHFYNSAHFLKSRKEGEKFKIITVANLVPVKGIEILIKAIRDIDDDAVQLTVLGDNENDYGEYLAALCIELNIENKIYFLGKQPDVRPFVADSDLYIIPTLDEGRKEGMPMALVEAMSMGIPVLGSNISGINFVLKDFPDLMFEASNEKELAEKLRELKSKGDIYRQKLGQTLRKYNVNN